MARETALQAQEMISGAFAEASTEGLRNGMLLTSYAGRRGASQRVSSALRGEGGQVGRGAGAREVMAMASSLWKLAKSLLP